VAPESLPSYIYNHEERESSLLPPNGHEEQQQPFGASNTMAVNSKPEVILIKPEPATKVTLPAKKTTNTNTAPSRLFPDLRECVKTTLTRQEIANLHLPPEVRLSHHDIDIVPSPVRYTNPMLIAARPQTEIIRRCKALLQNAVPVSNLIDDARDDDDAEFGIQVGGLGVFNKCTLDFWEKAAYASLIRCNVQEEVNWLFNSKRKGILTDPEINAIKSTFLDTTPNELFMAIGDIIVNTQDLTSLVDKRPLIGFVIDIA